MRNKSLYVAATGHGFGHTTRTAHVLHELLKRSPEVNLIANTTRPKLFQNYLLGECKYRSLALDVGVVQSDGFRQDKAETLKQLTALHARRLNLIEQEGRLLHREGVVLVLADIPWLAAPIAREAGVPCWMIGNFGWDFIYEAWTEIPPEVLIQIRRDYNAADRTFRLPMATPMSSFDPIIDVGFIASRPQNAGLVRQSLGLEGRENVLFAFGGLGMQDIPWDCARGFPEKQFITFDCDAPDFPNVTKVGDPKIRPVDVMPFCQQMVAKPGHSTFSEAVAQQLPTICIARPDFSEAQYLIDGLCAFNPHQLITREELLRGDWAFLNRTFQDPTGSVEPDLSGAATIAEAIAEHLQQI